MGMNAEPGCFGDWYLGITSPCFLYSAMLLAVFLHSPLCLSSITDIDIEPLPLYVHTAQQDIV